MSLVNSNLFLFNFISEMTLTIKGNGTQKIFNAIHDIPTEAYLNDKLINFTDDRYNTVYINGGEINNIKIIWNSFNGNLRDSFLNIKNIIYIDLSKLNVAMTHMTNLFYNCISLKSVNFSHLNTSQVENMGHLFSNYISLT